MIEALKYYRTRCGHVAFVRDVYNDHRMNSIVGKAYLPDIGWQVFFWSLSGTIHDSADKPHDLDLVEGSEFDPVAELVKVEGELKELKESLDEV